MKYLLIALIASLLPLQAQNAPPNPRRVRTAASTQNNPPLESNHTITLSGTFCTGEPVKLALTGIGPTFLTDQVTGEKQTIISCNYTLVKVDERYHLEYNVGARIKFETKHTSGKISVEFRDMVVRGKIACQLDTPVVISKAGDTALSLTLTKAK